MSSKRETERERERERVGGFVKDYFRFSHRQTMPRSTFEKRDFMAASMCDPSVLVPRNAFVVFFFFFGHKKVNRTLTSKG